jgi:hypothetical protein
MKVKIFRISFDLFKQMFEQDASTAFKVVAQGLPPDCELLYVNMPAVGIIELHIRSESFPEIATECIPEHITPVLATLSAFVQIS